MVYQNTTFYYFSGTGNSRRVAVWLADEAWNRGSTVKLKSIREADPKLEIAGGAKCLVSLVMPTHGFTAPWAMIRFALRLPRRKGAHAVVLSTRAGCKFGRVFTPGLEGTANLVIGLILALKGYRVRGAAGIDMPSNWISVHPGFPESASRAIIDRAESRVQKFADRIYVGHPCFKGWISLLLGLFLLPISLGYLFVGRFFLAKMFFASDRCNGCGLCAQHCPTQSIRMTRGGQPYWTFGCESCMRCMAFCPTRAVEANYLLGACVWILASIIPVAAFIRILPDWLTGSICVLILLAIMYPLTHFLLRIKPIRLVLARITPTHYYRRYREPDTRWDEL